MKKTIFAIAITILGMLTSCINKSRDQIEDEISSGVVLVRNEGYFEVILSNGESWFFSSYDEENGVKGMSISEDSVEVVTYYGTGFFISDNGQIATDARVVANTASDEDINRSIGDFISAFKTYAYNMYEQTGQEYENMEEIRRQALIDPSVSVAEYIQINEQCEALKNDRYEYAELYNNISKLRASESRIKYHNEISIAYNKSHRSGSRDFITCTLKKTDPDHDLAIIQTENRKTPEGKHIFTVGPEDPLEEYTFTEKFFKRLNDDKNSRLFMACFNEPDNEGHTYLSSTPDEIESRFDHGSPGNITDRRVKYTIPIIQGSSGAPVVNGKGQLVAINFISADPSDSYNYGLRVRYLDDLLNN